MKKYFFTLFFAYLSCLTICNAQKLLPITGNRSFEPTGTLDIDFIEKGTLLLSPVMSWSEGDSYSVYFSEPIPSSDIRICGQTVPQGAKYFHSAMPTSRKLLHWEAANGQEFRDHAVTIDISTEASVKLHIAEVMIEKNNGEIIPCYYCKSTFNTRDSISRQFDSKNYHWEANNSEEFEQFVEVAYKSSIKAEYSDYSGKVTFHSADNYIGGIDWASQPGSRSQYRLKLYRSTLSDNFAWKYVTESGETQYKRIEKGIIVSTLKVDEAVSECYIVPIGMSENGNAEELEIQEVSIIEGSQPKFETLVLWHANGKTTGIALSKKPVIQFVADKVLVQGKGINFEYTSNDILKFTYKKEDVVNDIDAPQNEVNYFRDDEHIVFNGIKSTDEVALYKLNGSRIPVKLNYSEANKVTLSLSGMPSGIYILKVNDRTTKITKQ